MALELAVKEVVQMVNHFEQKTDWKVSSSLVVVLLPEPSQLQATH